jgi:hypothetical protein
MSNSISNFTKFIIEKYEKALEEMKNMPAGQIRSKKGKLVEEITEEIIKFAWKEIGGSIEEIEINSKKIKIPIQEKYINNLQDEKIKKFIKENKNKFYYGLSVDKQVFYKSRLIVGIECKAYTENAMLKRILVDFFLLKKQFKNMACFLFQLESQLGGDYSELNKLSYGSPSTHTLMSYFPDVNLKIHTFVKGERRIKEPIHKNFKPIEKKQIERAVELLKQEFKQHHFSFKK